MTDVGQTTTADLATAAAPASGWLARLVGLIAVALALLSAGCAATTTPPTGPAAPSTAAPAPVVTGRPAATVPTVPPEIGIPVFPPAPNQPIVGQYGTTTQPPGTLSAVEDQIQVDNAFAVPADAPMQQVSHAQIGAGLTHIDGAVLVFERRGTGDHEEPGQPAECHADVLDHAVDEIVLRRIAAEVREWQHGN